MFCKTATVTRATIAMTPITMMMMVTGVGQGFFSFISESVGGETDRDRKERRGERVKRGRWRHTVK